MTAHLFKYKISYISAPKVACTSLKHFIWEVENGYGFQPYIQNSKKTSIHDIYRASRFKDLPHKRIKDHRKYAIVRDPVERFLSCYSNRVVYHKELSSAQLGRKAKVNGLKANPSIHEFVDRFQEYRAVSKSIFWHSRPLVSSLGHQFGYYEKVFKFGELSDFAAMIDDITGTSTSLRHLQTGGPKIDQSALSSQQIQKIQDHYAKDYDVFSDHFN